VRRSLARLWTNADGIQDQLLDAVAALAEALGPEPAVLGLEPWNEPFPGDRPFETFEAEDLAPFYRRVIARARAHAPHWLAFVEGTVLASEQGTALDLSGLSGVVYSPHFYDKVVMTGRQFDGELGELHAAFATFARDAASTRRALAPGRVRREPPDRGPRGLPGSAPRRAARRGRERHRLALQPRRPRRLERRRHGARRRARDRAGRALSQRDPRRRRGGLTPR
jgi:hypothetical protein